MPRPPTALELRLRLDHHVVDVHGLAKPAYAEQHEDRPIGKPRVESTRVEHDTGIDRNGCRGWRADHHVQVDVVPSAERHAAAEREGLYTYDAAGARVSRRDRLLDVAADEIQADVILVAIGMHEARSK